MRLLIIGGGGMAGHVLRQYMELRTNWDIWTTVRGALTEVLFNEIPKTSAHRLMHKLSLDVRDTPALERILIEIQPDVVINATGLLNDNAEDKLMESILVNSLLPHQLAQIGDRLHFRLIHISTDCVFSGKRGSYTESDIADGLTIYAKTKSLGEVADSPHLTIRTSIIGPELKTDGIGLFHWFMRQTGEIQGYSQVFWNGVTTLELAKAIEWCVLQTVTGLVHLAAPEKISKFELLKLLQTIFAKKDVTIRATDTLHSDKSLISTRSNFLYPVPPYPLMLQQLKEWMDFHSNGKYSYSYIPDSG